MPDQGRDDHFVSAAKFASLRGIRNAARHRLSEEAWNYLHCGTGDEVTARANVEAFDRYVFDVPLFSGVARPDTSCSCMGHELSFPAFTAPFGGGETVFYQADVAADDCRHMLSRLEPVAVEDRHAGVGRGQDDIDAAHGFFG